MNETDGDWVTSNANETLDRIVCTVCSSIAGRRYLQLQKQAEQLQEELYRSETGIILSKPKFCVYFVICCVENLCSIWCEIV